MHGRGMQARITGTVNSLPRVLAPVKLLRLTWCRWGSVSIGYASCDGGKEEILHNLIIILLVLKLLTVWLIILVFVQSTRLW